MVSYFGGEAYTGVLGKLCLFALFVILAGHVSLKWCVYCAAAYMLWVNLALGYDDSILMAAVALSVYALPMLYKKALTFVATYPLAHIFRYVSKILPKYVIGEDKFFTCDGCTPQVAEQRKAAIMELSEKWKTKYPKCREFSVQLKKMISDLRFTSGRCFPAFNEVVNSYLDPSMALDRTEGVDVVDIDGNSAMDISGSYGVNVCGYEMYKEFIETGWDKAKKQGLFLGSLDSTVLDNISMLRQISGHDEVSFHMSGTEAVMAAVRVARFNTKKKLVVTFGGAYHGWWDGMQPVVGNERLPDDVLCLKDMTPLALKVIQARKGEIAAVLINALQCFHLNQSPPSDPLLSTNVRKVGATPGYKEWLHRLRKTCSEAGVILIFDEVYTGFRLHPRGAQGAYNVDADIICYGKTLGGGLPVGVCCGPKHLMARGDPAKAARVAYVIGTFAGHPFVMASMNAFLKWLLKPETAHEWDRMHKCIDGFIVKANKTFAEKGYPLELANWFSVWSIMFTKPGRFHWMFQYYLKDAGVNMSWVGTGRLLFSLEWQQSDYDRLLEKMLVASEAMHKGGWWVPPVANIKQCLGLELVGALAKQVFKSNGI
jgi:glutamate-1-semialdehyde 2,1-aminomutase